MPSSLAATLAASAGDCATVSSDRHLLQGRVGRSQGALPTLKLNDPQPVGRIARRVRDDCERRLGALANHLRQTESRDQILSLDARRGQSQFFVPGRWLIASHRIDQTQMLSRHALGRRGGIGRGTTQARQKSARYTKPLQFTAIRRIADPAPESPCWPSSPPACFGDKPESLRQLAAASRST